MKKSTIFIAATAAAAAMAMSCTKENAARFEGDYSFKTSGTVSAVPADTPEGTAADTVTLSVLPESGQMNIIRDGKSRTDMVITMNIMGGDAVVFDRVNAEGLVLTLLQPYVTRRVSVETGSGIGYADVTVSGKAEKFTDVILFDLEYTGTVTDGDTVYRITDSAVDCVAKEND